MVSRRTAHSITWRGSPSSTGLAAASTISTCWESAEAAERFFENLPADNRARLAPNGAPARSSFPTHRVYDARSELNA